MLTSWKEIAHYFGKGVRTVQRWEHEMGLPVHRPNSKNKQTVIAFPEELQSWARQDRTSLSRRPLADVLTYNNSLVEFLHKNTDDLRTLTRLMRKERMAHAAERQKFEGLIAAVWLSAKARSDAQEHLSLVEPKSTVEHFASRAKAG